MNGCPTVLVRPTEGRWALDGRVMRLRYAGVDSSESLGSSLLLAVGLVFGHGTFFPAPFFSPLASSAGELAVAARPNAIGSCDGSGWA